MELTSVALFLYLLLLSLVSVAGQSDVFSFKSGYRPVAAYEGAKDVEITCIQEMNRSSSLFMVEVTHMDPITRDTRLIGKLSDLDPEEVAQGYHLSGVIEDGVKTMTLTIDTVRTQDDGVFIWDFKDDAFTVEVEKNVTVIRELNMLRLQFQDHEPITIKPEDPIEVDAGVYEVKCIAEGSNPPTRDVKLFVFGEEVIFSEKPKISLMEGMSVRRYRTTAVGTVMLPEERTVRELQCLARDTSGKQLSVNMDVSVMVPEEEINVKCKAKAHEENTVISAVCLVDTIEGDSATFEFEIGKTGEIIRPGQMDKNVNVTARQVSANQVEVLLTLSNPEKWHLESDFYLLINSTHGNIRKEILKLGGKSDTRGAEEGGDSADSLLASKGWILLLAMAVVWKPICVML